MVLSGETVSMFKTKFSTPKKHSNFMISLQVLVKDHLDKPVNRVQVRMVARQLFKQGDESEQIPCPDSAASNSEGLTVFVCNIPTDGIKAVLRVRKRNISCFIGVSAPILFL